MTDAANMIGGKLFWTEKDRISLLGLLRENVGGDAAMRLGAPELWKAAVAQLTY